MLCKMAVAEPGENWDAETFNGKPMELTMGWVDNGCPDSGILSLRYVTEKPEYAMKSLRRQLEKKTLAGDVAKEVLDTVHGDEEDPFAELSMSREQVEARERAAAAVTFRIAAQQDMAIRKADKQVAMALKSDGGWYDGFASIMCAMHSYDEMVKEIEGECTQCGGNVPGFQERVEVSRKA